MTMKWIVGYAVGAMAIVAPVGARLLMRPQPVAPALAADSVAEGRTLFTHEWKPQDDRSPGGDGIGPVYNALSCAQCHDQGGLGGSGNLDHNVTTFFRPTGADGKPVQGVIHAFGTEGYQENLSVVGEGFPNVVRPTLSQVRDEFSKRFSAVQVTQRNTPALFGTKLIDEIPEAAIVAQERAQKVRWHEPSGLTETVPVGRAMRLPGGIIGKFGWKAQNATLLEFVEAACANELGLGNPAVPQPTPMAFVNYVPPGLDLTTEQCEQIRDFVASLPRPMQMPQDPHADKGRQVFHSVGCAECHVPNMGSVEGVYSDLLLHRMGADLQGGGSYYVPKPEIPESPGDTPLPDEWRTPPLWGVSDSGPYMHDGRAITLQNAIETHAGQGKTAADNFRRLSGNQQTDLLAFLGTLKAPH